MFSILGFTPEPIILAARALKPRKHIIIHDKGVAFNEDNVRFLPNSYRGYEKVELNESFGTIYDTLKEQMVFNEGRSYAINITGGKIHGSFCRYICEILVRLYFMWTIMIDPNLRRPIPGSEYLLNLVLYSN